MAMAGDLGPLAPLTNRLVTYVWVKRILDLPLLRDVVSPLIGLILFRPRIDWHKLKSMVRGRVAVVFGAGPSLASGLARLKGILAKYRGALLLACADGAVKALLEQGVTPDIVVSDLDGDPTALSRAYREGSVFVILCHGDNVGRQLLMRRYVRRVFMTSQVYLLPPLIWCTGGFTDGDRAVHMLARLGCRRLVLVGMDFGQRIGRYSIGARKDLARKRVKLRVGRLLLEAAVRGFGLKVLRVGG